MRNRTYLFTGLFLAILSSCSEPSSVEKTKEIDEGERDIFMGVTALEDKNNTKLNQDTSLLFEAEESYANPCDAVLQVVFQKLSITSHKTYLETLHYLYQSENQKQLDERRKSSVGISVLNYAEGSWNDNKTSITQIMNKYREQRDYSLQTEEMLVLNSTYSRKEDVEKAITAWNNCVAGQQRIPFLREQHNDESTVIVSFRMFPNEYTHSWERVRVKKITYSNNLELVEGGIIEGRTIPYKGEYTLKFNRKNLKKASISVDLEKGNIIPITIASLDSPEYTTVWVTETSEAKVYINAKNSTLRIKFPDGRDTTMRFREQNRSRQKWNFRVNTNLNYKEAIIVDYYIVGGLAQFIKDYPIIGPKGNLILPCFLETAPKIMTGKFVIVYKVPKTICVANCPEE